MLRLWSVCSSPRRSKALGSTRTRCTPRLRQAVALAPIRQRSTEPEREEIKKPIPFEERPLRKSRYTFINTIINKFAPLYFRYWSERQPHGLLVGGEDTHTPYSTSPVDRLANLCLLMAVILLLLGLFSSRMEIPHSDRVRVSILPPALRKILGENATTEVLTQFQDVLVPPSHPIHRHITAIGNQITDANNLPRCEYVIIDSPQINAFVSPGNTVFVFTGILPLMQDRNGAAMVIAHELSHLLAGHTTDYLPTKVIAKTVLQSVLGFAGDIAYTFGLELPFSRKDEYEADTIGLHLLAQACFDVDEATKVFERLSEKQESVDIEFTSSHPTWENRSEWLLELAHSDKVVNLSCDCPKAENSTWSQIWTFRSQPMLSRFNYAHGFPHIEGEDIQPYVAKVIDKTTKFVDM